jgi:hypothetical protein
MIWLLLIALLFYLDTLAVDWFLNATETSQRIYFMGFASLIFT